MKSLICIAHDMRSTHNVGSLLRTCEGLGIETVYLTGYTPYPHSPKDTRLPHEALKLHKQISKTALGAETYQSWSHHTDIYELIAALKSKGYTVAALEQAADSVSLPEFTAPEKLAIILGREVEGVAKDILDLTDIILEIPMHGRKESYNVVQSAAMALYHCRLIS